MTGIRVATIPDEHPYVTATLPPGVDRRRFPSAQWAPSPLLDIAVVCDIATELDVVHVHFGYESLSTPKLRRWVAEIAHSPIALAVTVHDLHNPHERSATPQSERLSVLLAQADAVSTVTAGAAAEISRRWNRVVSVIEHPTLLGHDGSARTAREGRRVGLHFKSLRANTGSPAELVAAAAAGARDAGGQLRVDVHADAASDPRLQAVRELADRGDISLAVHDRFTDAELETYLAGLDVSVLPYQFGTHSGWLELCRDLGTAVVAPDCGFYQEQWPASVAYRHNQRDGLDGPSLQRAVAAALRVGPLDFPDRSVRLKHKQRIQLQHAELYQAAIASSRMTNVGTRP